MSPVSDSVRARLGEIHFFTIFSRVSVVF